MASKPGGPAALDSPMTSHPAVKGLASDDGTYNKHPDLGPQGESGGLPLKFFDNLDKTVIKPQQVDNPMYVTPTPHKTTGKTHKPASEPYPGRGFPFKEK